MNTSQIVKAADHIKIFEIITSDGDVIGVLSTGDKIKTFPRFKEIVSIGDANYSQTWLSAHDTKLFNSAYEAFNKKAI